MYVVVLLQGGFSEWVKEGLAIDPSPDYNASASLYLKDELESIAEEVKRNILIQNFNPSLNIFSESYNLIVLLIVASSSLHSSTSVTFFTHPSNCRLLIHGNGYRIPSSHCQFLEPPPLQPLHSSITTQPFR